jgi:uncharacterized protein YoxC
MNNQALSTSNGASAVAAAPVAPPVGYVQAVQWSVDLNALIRERDQLKAERDALRVAYDELRNDMACVNLEKLQNLEAEHEEYQRLLELSSQKNEELSKQIEALQEENALLRKTIQELQRELQEQRDMVQSLKVAVGRLEKSVEILQSRDKPITVREIMRKLESHVCLKLAGSKSKARKELFNFAKFREKHREKEVFNEIGPDVVDLIDRFKDAGDEAAHDMRPEVRIDEFQNLIAEKDDDAADVASKEKLVILLRAFDLVDKSGMIVLKDAF